MQAEKEEAPEAGDLISYSMHCMTCGSFAARARTSPTARARRDADTRQRPMRGCGGGDKDGVIVKLR